MGTSTARIYRTIYLVIYGPVRETVNLVFGCDNCVFFFPLYDLFLYTNSETSDTFLPCACSCFVILYFRYTAFSRYLRYSLFSFPFSVC